MDVGVINARVSLLAVISYPRWVQRWGMLEGGYAPVEFLECLMERWELREWYKLVGAWWSRRYRVVRREETRRCYVTLKA